MSKVCIIGKGHVGEYTAKFLNPKHVHYYDEPKGIGTISHIQRAKFVFICVPTQSKRGVLDTSIIEKVLKKTVAGQVIYIRSTVPIGTMYYLDSTYDDRTFYYFPEFFEEHNKSMDLRHVILGCALRYDLKLAIDFIKRYFGKRLRAVPYRTAEAFKLFSNAALATKVSMANDFKKLSDSFNVDWRLISDMLQTDERIGKHMNVPGPDGKLGFGGKCLPKDTLCLYTQAKNRGFKSTILKATLDVNKMVRND